jgi:transcriptional regulator with XRE-family HTH domain
MAKLRVKEIAEQKKINQRDLAEKSGVTPQLINRYWNYPMQRVDLDALVSIAKALGVKFADLIDTEGEDSSEEKTPEESVA